MKFLPTHVLAVPSRVSPSGHSHRKEPAVFTQRPFGQTPGKTSHSFTSVGSKAKGRHESGTKSQLAWHRGTSGDPERAQSCPAGKNWCLVTLKNTLQAQPQPHTEMFARRLHHSVRDEQTEDSTGHSWHSADRETRGLTDVSTVSEHTGVTHWPYSSCSAQGRRQSKR